ncbi:DUF6751 family protein [Terrisporobacter glycolicus]|uniref:Uncharacterized protein n=1 Tax=Terrisporobacter glycolicus ATCC 14880 = DSM 1288 TaxID=1121315 RepID=A0ABZ2EXC7_9FIRM|nr:DUF6751 family protein [Terrisporobacter glycolicus]
MKFNENITLYNAYYDKTSDALKYRRTYIRGVSFQGKRALSSASKDLLANDNAYNIYIPFNADIEDKIYVRPKEYEKLSEAEKEKYFTFNNDDKIVKGIIDFELTGRKPNNIAYLENSYDDVVNITSISINDYCSEKLRHWKVGAK